MIKYTNLVLFRINTINENVFSIATKLIDEIQNNSNYNTVEKLLETENYKKIRYKRVRLNEEESEYQISKNVDLEKEITDVISSRMNQLKLALNNKEHFLFLFLFNKTKKIRPYLTDFQYFFLLKQNYHNCKLFINDHCDATKDYFTTSHFLYFETLKDSNSVWYKLKDNDSYQSLQLKNIGSLTKFIPLIEINLDIYNVLSLRISELWDKNGQFVVDTESAYAKNIFMKIWQSCMSFMNRTGQDNKVYFEELDEYRGLSFLAFYIYEMYVHYLDKRNENIDAKTLKLFTLEVTDGLLQLIENVCLHSEYHRGYLSMIIDTEDDYNLQVDVIDYANSNERLSNTSVLNHRFYKSFMSNDNLKKYFSYATLKDFFAPEFVNAEQDMQDKRFYGNFWDLYYKRAENAAFHYGLQVFASVVKGYMGMFYVRSCYTYSCLENQIYSFNSNDKLKSEKLEVSKTCFPGTHYKIKFPLYIQRTQKNIGFNSKISDQAFRDILKYSVASVVGSDYTELIRVLSPRKENTQQDKEKAIKKVKECIAAMNERCFKNEKYSITRIPFGNFVSGQMMEYFCKALFLYIKEKKEINLKIAITGCSDECMLEFVRWFLIFYDKQNFCEEMKYVEIYIVGTDSREDFLLSGTSLAISQGRVEKVCMSKGVFNQKQRIISQAIWRTVNDKSNYVDEEYEIIPYDVIVEYDNKQKIFENAVLKTLDTDLQSMEFGCKVEKCHVRIGSKIHITDNFYEAHSLFHSNYYTSRFAFLLAQRLMSNLQEEKGKEFCEELKKKSLLIIGYETYSELLICETKKILKNSFGFLYVDHVIFDVGSGETFRLWDSKYKDSYYVNIVPINSTLSTHNKMISLYKKYNMSEANILANYAMILIRDSVFGVDGTHKRICKGSLYNKKIPENMSHIEQKYWKGIDTENKKVYTTLVKKEVDYIILIENDWKLPLECDCCYPNTLVKEEPLIETNKASVVPTFMIGIKPEKKMLPSRNLLHNYNKKINNMCLKPEIIDGTVLQYAHIYRNGNDYRFYINSENLYKKIESQNKKDIDLWCEEVKSILKYRVPKSYFHNLLNSFIENRRQGGNVYILFNKHVEKLNMIPEEISNDVASAFLDDIKEDIKTSNLNDKKVYYDSVDAVERMISDIPKEKKIQSYDIIVSPVHHSNATWIDQVTENIFENMPAILHFDVQKEFRDNMKTKYSNLSTLYHNLCRADRKFEINFHFVDDTIISGKTFNRAKTLIQSLFPLDAYSSVNGEPPRVNLFKSVILLFNRLSSASQLLYVNKGMYFSYINIYVPNLRNHEDACLMCKLVSDMNKVKRRSATNLTAEFFERKEIKYIRLDEMQYDTYFTNERKKQLESRNYKRLYCNHRVFEEIGEIGDLRNETDEIRRVMINLISEKIQSKGLDLNDKMEWIISYFKVYSRPVVTYRKSFLEAYFELAINMMEILFGTSELTEDMHVLEKFYEEFVVRSKSKEKLLDAFIKTLLGGLGRVKSNYIIRSNQIIRIFDWYSDNVAERGTQQYKNFEKWYIYNIKRLIELSGDETKCLWLEKLLLEGMEWRNGIKNYDFYNNYGIETLFGKYLYLENTRLIYDAVSDFNKNFYAEKNDTVLQKEIKTLLQNDRYDLAHYYVDNFFSLIQLDKEFFVKENCDEREKYDVNCIACIVAMVKMYEHLNRKVEIKKDTRGRQMLESVTQIEEDYVELLDYMKDASEATKVVLFGADKQEDRLKIIKQKLLEQCVSENVPFENVRDILTVNEHGRLKLYSIATSSVKNPDEKSSNNEKKELLYAERLLNSFEKEDPDLVCLGKTIVIDFEKKCALLKIHNNWSELIEDCQKKDINKVHVEPFYFFFVFENADNNEILRGLRNILTFRDSLVKRIEEDFNNNLIQLTVSSQKQAKDLSNDRAAGHTKMDEIKNFLYAYIKIPDGQNPDEICNGMDHDVPNEVVMGNMLKLLADSYCSHQFKELYSTVEKPLEEKDMHGAYGLEDYKKSLKKYSHIFKKCVFSKVDGSSKGEERAVIHYEIEDKDMDVLNVDFEEVWILFIVLLVQNALNHGVTDKNRHSTVTIYNEGKYIVVRNKIDPEKTKIDQMKELLQRVPEGKEEGISLWVMDQCIRYYWRRYYWQKYIIEWKEKGEYHIRKVLEKLEKLENCCISIETTDNNEEIEIKLPLIFERKGE